MIWLRLQMAVVVIALVAAGTQCLAQCVAKPCHAAVAADESVPPCHRHQTPKQTNSQESCRYLVLVADHRAPSVVSVELQRLDFAAGLAVAPLVQPHFGGDSVLRIFSPPLSANIALFNVLRV